MWKRKCQQPVGSQTNTIHHALFWRLFCGAENNYRATKECASVQSQIMENISRLGQESKCLTPYSNGLF